MKKAVLLVLCSLSVFFLHAQVKLDSVVTVGDNKKVFTYDEEGKAVEQVDYTWNENPVGWSPIARNLTQYTPNGSDYMYFQWDAGITDWNPLYRQVLAHSANDSIYTHYSWDATNQVWQPATRAHQVYDSNGMLNQVTSFEWDPVSGIWKGVGRSTHITILQGWESIYETWNTAANDWQVSGKTEYLTNAADSVIQQTDYAWLNNEWTLLDGYFRLTYAYDSNGNQTEWSYAEWNTVEMDWNNKQRRSYAFDTSGNVTFDASYTWNDDDNFWWGLYGFEYTYNADGTMATSNRLDFDPATTNWIPFPDKAYAYVYTPEGNLSEKIESRWLSSFNAVVYYRRETYDYDPDGNIIDYAAYRWNAFLENWYNEYREVTAYDLSVDPADLIYPIQHYPTLFQHAKVDYQETYSLNVQFNDWQLDSEIYYYFSEFTTATNEAPAPEALKLFPNPVSNLLTPAAKAPKASSYQITDLNGRVLQQEPSWNGEGVDVSRLIPGSYVIRLIEGNRVVTGKFIKS